MAIIKGGDMMLFIKKGNETKSIAFATNHTLTISADTKETSTKDNGGKWQSSEVGLLSWTCSSENLCADAGSGLTYKDLFEMMISRQPITGVFAMEGNSPDWGDKKLDAVPESTGWTPKENDGLTGDMIITNLTKNAPNGDNATFTVDFTGVGELKPVGQGSGATLYSNGTQKPVVTTSKTV